MPTISDLQTKLKLLREQWRVATQKDRIFLEQRAKLIQWAIDHKQDTLQKDVDERNVRNTLL